MQYQPSKDQRALLAEMDDALSALLPIARVHVASHETPETWAALNELGIFMLALDEASGGLGLGAVEEVLAVAALGRRLVGVSVLATLGLVHAATPDIGRVAAGFRGNNGVTILAEEAADAVLVRTGDEATLYPVPAMVHLVANNPWPETFARVEALDSPLTKFDTAGVLRLRLIDAAALAGLADATLAMAVDYAKLREQFGRPIGSFQAVKHHCANMAVQARCALDLVTFAAVAIDNGRPDAAFLINSAFFTAARAAIDNASLNIQIHGGIGFSEEADPHLFLKRAQLLITIGGGMESALDRLGQPIAA